MDNSQANYASLLVNEESNVIVLFSYNTPVAMSVVGVHFVTDKRYSATTNRHIKKFVGNNEFTVTTQTAIESWLHSS
ncbi:MAG: hypothetical protein EKK57_02730 [Proteobacteria bacterium]|nr:MAG: hypothetical protein EKK57_02730 [Pseudomonadota bacterium]